MTRRPRVLVIAEAVTLAHVARASALARTLDPAHFDVHAAWDPRYDQLLGSLPYPIHHISTLPGELFLRRLSSGRPMHDVATLRSYVREESALLDAIKPDVVVSDFRFSLLVSARSKRIPLVTVANAYWSPYAGQTFMFPEYDYPLHQVIGTRLSRSLFQAFRGIGFAAHTRPLNLVLREHGLAAIGGDIRRMYTEGDYTAYADIPGLAQLRDVPSHHRTIGAVVWAPAVPQPTWWPDVVRDRPLIYVTPGSSGDRDTVAVVLRGLADLPVLVIAATAGRSAPTDIPANARVASFLPGTEASARAALVVCNGGSPTTYQALAAGVPVLGVVSNNMDQHLNMEAVVRAGAGATVRARGLSETRIRGLVERLLGSSASREAARRLQHAHRQCDVAIRFPELLKEVVDCAR